LERHELKKKQYPPDIRAKNQKAHALSRGAIQIRRKTFSPGGRHKSAGINRQLIQGVELAVKYVFLPISSRTFKKIQGGNGKYGPAAERRRWVKKRGTRCGSACLPFLSMGAGQRRNLTNGDYGAGRNLTGAD
jgi:hypothetical protein